MKAQPFSGLHSRASPYSVDPAADSKGFGGYLQSEPARRAGLKNSTLRGQDCAIIKVMKMKDSQQKIRNWLKEKLSVKGRGAASALAKEIDADSATITRMLRSPTGRGYRIITGNELIKMAEFFGENPPGFADQGQNAAPAESLSTNSAASIPQEDLCQWLREQLAAKGRGARADLARYMNLSPELITRMTKGTRSIGQRDLNMIMAFLGKAPPGVRQETALDARKSAILSLYEASSEAEQRAAFAFLQHLHSQRGKGGKT
ncbi:MAG: hypothetical protein DU429_08705 [Candidatus Tokpelaia sp.]|nr:MAG: hypothetical protein DU430_09110 [Candidatus Tokpelaia sp.]KAA6205055.1 MAG: hypothetical protein DU429_08705 [Candidatus Tokpelaia sp.]